MSFASATRYKLINHSTQAVIAISTNDRQLTRYIGGDYPDQYWFILNFKEKGFKLMNAFFLGDVIADSNGNLIRYNGDDYPDQYWSIKPAPNNYGYVFTNKSTGRVIADSNGNLIAYKGQDFPDQHWDLFEVH
ncbi:hypothetical protein NIES2101_42785 [Calothrix sp. HK-06]|nr:hypothetical protein NIES2101_42785 [Calothrix sp. HK-06]